MAHAPLSLLEQQVARVQRRLFLLVLAQLLFRCLAVALALTAAWFLLQPHLPAAAWLRQGVPSALLAVAVGASLVLAWRRCPSRLGAALLLDERFGLKERVTTSLSLPPQERTSDAGQALFADVTQRLTHLDVSSRFPVRVSWTELAAPACALLLALASFLYHPALDQAGGADQGSDQLAFREQGTREDEQLKKVMDNLKPQVEKAAGEREGGMAELDGFDDEMGKISRRPRETEAERKARAAELSKLEAEMKKKKDHLATNAETVREQLMQEPNRLQKKPKDGPARDLENALAKGDSKKAAEEVDRLSKALKDGQLSKEEQEKLQEQLQELKEDLQQDLQRLSRQKDEEKLLKDLADQGKIDPEALDHELDQLHQQGGQQDPKKIEDKLNELASKGQLDPQAAREVLDQLRQSAETQKDLQDAAEQLEQARQAMKQGDGEKAGESLKQAGDKLDGQAAEQELRQLVRKQQRVARAKQAMLEASQRGRGPGGQAQPGAGSRLEEKDDRVASERVQAENNPDYKGYSELVGDGPRTGQQKPRKPAEVLEDIKQRSQQAPGALRAPNHIAKDATEMTKGYFENLGGQQSQVKPPPQKP
jgi:hypothetical protein